MTDKVKVLYCSFCGKNQDEVTKLIAGPTVFICNECVRLCEQILDDPEHLDLIDQPSMYEIDRDLDRALYAYSQATRELEKSQDFIKALHDKIKASIASDIKKQLKNAEKAPKET